MDAQNTASPIAFKAPDRPLPPKMALLQRWRNADHEDRITLTRDDVIGLIEETRAALNPPTQGT